LLDPMSPRGLRIESKIVRSGHILADCPTLIGDVVTRFHQPDVIPARIAEIQAIRRSARSHRSAAGGLKHQSSEQALV
jgi:hypothetical protein